MSLKSSSTKWPKINTSTTRKRSPRERKDSMKLPAKRIIWWLIIVPISARMIGVARKESTMMSAARRAIKVEPNINGNEGFTVTISHVIISIGLE